jgi:hypothetical protein
MRHSIFTDKQCLDARRRQRDSNGCVEMISNAADFVDLAVRPRRERPKARADYLYLLSLVPAPTFAIMAALTASHGGSMSDVLSSAALNESPLTRMSLMYVLMSVFHLAPWLNLLSRRSIAARPF